MGERKTVKRIYNHSFLKLTAALIQLTAKRDCDEVTDLGTDPSRNTTLEGVFEAPSIAETVRHTVINVPTRAGTICLLSW